MDFLPDVGGKLHVSRLSTTLDLRKPSLPNIPSILECEASRVQLLHLRWELLVRGHVRDPLILRLFHELQQASHSELDGADFPALACVFNLHSEVRHLVDFRYRVFNNPFIEFFELWIHLLGDAHKLTKRF
jgi:hypothetical protein